MLHGTWKIFDSKNRKVSEWEFDHGDRNGKSVWYYPNGQKRREVDYQPRPNRRRSGRILRGSAAKWLLREKYVDGRRLAAQVDNYSPGQKRAEGWILYAKEITKSNYDFWNGIASIQVIGTEGPEPTPRPVDLVAQERPEADGRPLRSRSAGRQIHLVVSRTARSNCKVNTSPASSNGKFTWWHPSGQKQLEGAYVAGVLTGKWTRWNAEGHVVEVGDYTADGKQLASEPKPLPSVDEAGAPKLEAIEPSTASNPNSTSSRLKR